VKGWWLGPAARPDKQQCAWVRPLPDRANDSVTVPPIARLVPLQTVNERLKGRLMAARGLDRLRHSDVGGRRRRVSAI